MKVFFIVGEMLFVGLIGAAIFISRDGNVGAYLDIPSAILLIGCVLGMSLMSFSPSEIVKAVGHTFGHPGSRDDLEFSAYFWLCTIRNLYIVGILGTLVGLVGMLQNLSDPNAIGPSMAIAILTFFYGIILSAMLPIPAYYSISRRLADECAGEEG